MEQLGTLLGEIRTERGWSLGQLAQRAGVSKATLSRWESGNCLPRVPELKAALDALDVASAQRARLFACLEAPRAIRYMRASYCGPLPASGDLLRTLRQRRNWTQEQLAARVGVGQSAIARWERGERLPANEQMQALCFTLGAKEEEILALTIGRFAAAQEILPSEPERVSERIDSLLHDKVWNLVDLRFLTLERTLWQRAIKEERERPLLALAYSVHAHYLSNHRRWEESRVAAERALALTPQADSTPETAMRATLMIAAAEANSGISRAPNRAAHLLWNWLLRSPSPLYTAWIQSDMARYLAMAGQNESAVSMGRQATVHHDQDQHLRQIDLARVLLMLGSPGEALDRLPTLSEKQGDYFIKEAFTRCEAHLQLGKQGEAHDWLQRAYPVIQAEQWHHLHPQAEALARRF